MYTAEVPSTTSHDLRRVVRATALLLTGAAVHLWLFPFPVTPGRTRLVDEVAAGVNALARQGAVGTSGREPAVTMSALGEVTPRGTRTWGARPAIANRVKVLIETVNPTLTPSFIPTRPMRLADTLLAPVNPAESGLIQHAAVADTAVASPVEFPPLTDAPIVPQMVPAAAELQLPPVPGRSLTPPSVHTVLQAGHRDVPKRPERPSDERQVSHVLQQYREAYESLDVDAAQTVWPTVDARALGAAFRQLAGQRVTFDSCGVSVSGSGSQATARCKGQAEYVPKVGGRRAYTASGEWVFDLQKENAAWRIINANANIK